jgi:hypothetical protein
MGGFLLVENTEDHQALYGPDRYAVFHYNSAEKTFQKAKGLITNPALSLRLKENVRDLFTSGKNAYKDRFLRMIK